MGWIVFPQNSYAELQTPTTLDVLLFGNRIDVYVFS